MLRMAQGQRHRTLASTVALHVVTRSQLRVDIRCHLRIIVNTIRPMVKLSGSFWYTQFNKIERQI